MAVRGLGMPPDGRSLEMDFPDDENGQVLRRMLGAVDDLTKPRPIDFAHVLPNRDAAEAMARRARDLGGQEDGWGCFQPG